MFNSIVEIEAMPTDELVNMADRYEVHNIDVHNRALKDQQTQD